MPSQQETNRITVVITSLIIVAVSAFLYQAFQLRQTLLFLIGVGLGITLLHAAFGFTGGWRQFIRYRNSLGIRAQLVLLAITSLLFFPMLGGVFADLRVSAALAPVGYSVLIGAFLFGIGMQLGGGCGSGTLYTFGQGQVDMLVTLLFFIVGATIGSAHLHWWLALGDVGTISLIQSLGWSTALAIQFLILAALYLLVKRMHKAGPDRKQHGQSSLLRQFLFGPWVIWWGVAGLALFNLLTMLTAGHPWSITFAFGLWGSKIWAALGGDVASWPYWSSGYPAQALSSSVLADTTSLMDFGLIFGAMLAAALAGHYAPAMNLNRNRMLAAVLGGLLLGYGARLAFGCNIGALLAGISSGSLHGWLWLVAAFTGSIAGVHLRIVMKLDKPIAAVIKT